MEERLIELESRVAFQDDALRKLEEMAAEQARQIYRMSQELEAVKSQLKASAPSLLARQEDEAPPPHY
ncbi:MAG: SlyX family protein [Deferrisomatales bacterium]|nr:SlyX family protein [Deferrisomatales bacterium]